MLEVNVRDLRARMSHYMDQVELGETLTIIRRSQVIASLQPHGIARKPIVETVTNGILFRRYLDGDQEAVHKLYGPFDPQNNRDLYTLTESYIQMAGDFLIGIKDNEVIAMGGFRLSGIAGQAELQYVRVRSDFEQMGVTKQLTQLLIHKAKQRGYTNVV